MIGYRLLDRRVSTTVESGLLAVGLGTALALDGELASEAAAAPAPVLAAVESSS